MRYVLSDIQGTMPIWNVVILGVGIVFFGLICIIVLCSVTGAIMQRVTAARDKRSAAASQAEPIPNREELIAAISCAVAEELGTDVSHLRILSFKERRSRT